MVAMDAEVRAGLLAGLEVRRPRFSRSGFFVDAAGTVATTIDAVAECGRVTIDGGTGARVSLNDAASGLALLVPETPLAPAVIAAFQDQPERAGSEIMVSGFSYEDRLPAPVMTFGTLSESTGLEGEPTLKRLAVQALPGDAGGPVLDPAGAVIGMLLPASAGGDRVLPAGVHFALAGAELSRLLTAAGLAPTLAVPEGALPPADLSARGTGMTVLVSCWD
jgi:S1-C subfamily serine protease